MLIADALMLGIIVVVVITALLLRGKKRDLNDTIREIDNPRGN